MSKFKNIEKLGIDLLYAYQCDRKVTVIYAEDLESILQSAQVVYCDRTPRDKKYEWLGEQEYESWKTKNKQMADGKFNTHSALLIGIEPIKKTKAEAALELLSKITNDGFHLPNNADIIEQSKRILEMKDDE